MKFAFVIFLGFGLECLPLVYVRGCTSIVYDSYFCIVMYVGSELGFYYDFARVLQDVLPWIAYFEYLGL